MCVCISIMFCLCPPFGLLGLNIDQVMNFIFPISFG